MDTPTEVDWCMGAAFLISHTFYNELKGFDEKFFLYVEDMDICYRCWKKNKKVVYYPLSKMTHVHQRSSQRLNKKTLIHLKSFFYFFRKNRFKIKSEAQHLTSAPQREKETFQRDISFKKEKRQYEQNQIRINAIIEIIELLSYFEYSISLTSSCIDTTKKLSVTEHDNAYKKELIKIHRLVSLICVYTPYYNYIRTIEGSHSVYWGRQRKI